MRGVPGERKGYGIALVNVEVRNTAKILASHRDTRPQFQGVGTPNCAQPVFAPPNPWHDAAIIETEDRLHAHRHPPAAALYDAHQVNATVVLRNRHEIDNRSASAAGEFEFSLQHQRLVAIMAAHHNCWRGGRDEPASVLWGSQQRGKAGGRIETRHTEPIDRAVAPN